MNEGRSKAIPLRRTRTASLPAVPLDPRRWRDGLGPGMRLLVAPPRQVWLATLGGAALGLRVTQSVWARLVAEGEAVERWLRGHRSETSPS